MRIPITFVGSDGFPPNSQERYVRLKADFDNFRKRSQEEGRKLSQLGREAVLQDLIPLVESLERAIDASVTVIEEVRPGFMREGKPLRPASVVVAC